MSKTISRRVSGAFAIAAFSAVTVAPAAMAVDLPTPSTEPTTTSTVFGELPRVSSNNTVWDATISVDADKNGVLDEPISFTKILDKTTVTDEDVAVIADKLQWKTPEVTNSDCSNTLVKLAYYPTNSDSSKLTLCLTESGWLTENATPTDNLSYDNTTNTVNFSQELNSTVTPTEPTPSTTEAATPQEVEPTSTPTIESSETTAPVLSNTEEKSTVKAPSMENSILSLVKTVSSLKEAPTVVKPETVKVDSVKPNSSKIDATKLDTVKVDSVKKVETVKPVEKKASTVEVLLPAMVAAPVQNAPKASVLLSAPKKATVVNAAPAPAKLPAAKGTYYLSGRFYEDVNKSGAWEDDVDKPLQNKELSLYFAGDLVTKVKTNGEGVYKFTGLENGAYDLKWAADGAVGVIQQGPYFTADKANPPLITNFNIDIDNTNGEDYNFGLVMTKSAPAVTATPTPTTGGDYTSTASSTPTPSTTSSTPTATKVDSGDNSSTKNASIAGGGVLTMLLGSVGMILSSRTRRNRSHKH